MQWSDSGPITTESSINNDKSKRFHQLKCPQRMVFTAEPEITLEAPVSVIAKEWYMIVADLEAREYEFVAYSFAIICGWPCRSGSRWADRGRENDRRYLHRALALALLYLHYCTCTVEKDGGREDPLRWQQGTQSTFYNNLFTFTSSI